MFNLFNQSNHTTVIDKVAITQNAKWQHCLDEWKQNKKIVFVAWFSETFNAFKSVFSEDHPDTYLASEMQFVHLFDEPQFVFLEHFPLHSKEAALFEKLHLKEAVIYSSLDEPLFVYAGSGKLKGLFETLGMKDNEILQHKMISASIRKLQKKIEANITVDQGAASQQQWLNSNAEHRPGENQEHSPYT